MTKVVSKHNQSVTELNPKIEGAWLPLVGLSQQVSTTRLSMMTTQASVAELDPKIKGARLPLVQFKYLQGMTKVVPKQNQSVTELNPKVEGSRWLLCLSKFLHDGCEC